MASEVLRGKALDIIAQRAKVTDEAGNEVDLQPPAGQDATAEAGEAVDDRDDGEAAGAGDAAVAAAQDRGQETEAAAQAAE